jgi:hypothetical protein
MILLMGQVITFPAKRTETHSVLTAERRAALVTGLCAITYLMGFFIAGPMLAIYAFGFATTAHPASAISCVVGLLAVWPITRFAYKRI